ncbi:MAG: hypothetical protein BM556_13955 [Bacteriovorax sp. MedPE-SWde]|nr:MAG: hypothetical protein BM556_13955 [Bacteriovorax sp. MedPE-SWde]
MNELHKKVQVIILHRTNNNINTLLLQTKKDRGEYWQNVTGSVDGDESWEDAASRELEEETGLKGEVHLIDMVFKFHDRWDRDVEERVYYAEVDDTRVTISEEEHQSFRWCNSDDLSEKDFGHANNFQAFKEALRCIKE